MGRILAVSALAAGLSASLAAPTAGLDAVVTVPQAGAILAAPGPVTPMTPVPPMPPVAPVAPVAPVRYGRPVPGAVVRGFEPPPTPYAAGHRGVDLATAPGEPVRAAAAGTVSFAGTIAGRGVVVIAHADGISTEYEPVLPSVTAGNEVSAGAAIGTISGSHGTCSPGGCLHWGARRGDAYLNPLSLLDRGTVRLVPWTN